MSDHRPEAESCCCASLAELAVVPMGGEGLDEQVFASLDRVQEHGGDQWWLHVSRCNKCGQNWMIASDERIYDNYYLRRLSPDAVKAIQKRDQWPDEFQTYEQVLSLGVTLSKPWTFLDPRSPALVTTAEHLRRERPEISVEEVAYLLGMSARDATRLFQRPTMIDRFRAWASRR